MRSMRSVVIVALASCSTTLAFQHAKVSAPLTRFASSNSVKHPFLQKKTKKDPDSSVMGTVGPSSALHLFNIFKTAEPEPEPEPEIIIPSFALNIPAASAWVALTAWAFSTVAPGELNDNALLEQFLEDPVHPGVNALFYLVFNFFAVIPVILASVMLPQGRSNTGLPAGPFLAASTFLGYFAFGPYLALRAPPKDVIDDPSEISWFTRNVLENKVFAAGTVAFALYLPVAAGLLDPAVYEHPAEVWQGFVDLISTDRFAAVSCADISILLAVTIAATPRDYLLRNPDSDLTEARKVAALTALVPFIGTAVYCAVRPALPQEEEEY
jgi:hypothetical protein